MPAKDAWCGGIVGAWDVEDKGDVAGLMKWVFCGFDGCRENANGIVVDELLQEGCRLRRGFPEVRGLSEAR